MSTHTVDTTNAYLTMLDIQMRTAGLVMQMIGGLFKSPASTEAWKTAVNVQSQHLADLYNLADSTQPPAEYRELHVLYRRALLKANQSLKLALDTFTEDPDDVSAWLQAKSMMAMSGIIMTQARSALNTATRSDDKPGEGPSPEAPVVA